MPPTSMSAPTAGGIKCLSVVAICIPRILIGCPGVWKLNPEYARTTMPRVISRTETMVLVFISNFLLGWADRRSNGFPAGDEPQQNRHYGDEQEDVDQVARGAGHQPQQPQNRQDYRNRI